jgi:SecD/SecF fusion protein
MTSISPRPAASPLRRHLWKILLTLGLVAWAIFELIPLRTIPFADYARQHATVNPAGFATLVDEAVARKDRQQAPSAYVALQQIGRERKLDLSQYFPRTRSMKPWLSSIAFGRS